MHRILFNRNSNWPKYTFHVKLSCKHLRLIEFVLSQLNAHSHLVCSFPGPKLLNVWQKNDEPIFVVVANTRNREREIINKRKRRWNFLWINNIAVIFLQSPYTLYLPRIWKQVYMCWSQCIQQCLLDTPTAFIPFDDDYYYYYLYIS